MAIVFPFISTTLISLYHSSLKILQNAMIRTRILQDKRLLYRMFTLADQVTNCSQMPNKRGVGKILNINKREVKINRDLKFEKLLEVTIKQRKEQK